MAHSFKIARGFLYLSALYVALVTPSTLFPFIVGKYAWFRGSVDLALIAFALGLLFQDPHGEMWERLKRVFRKPLVIAVSVFTALFILAGFFGIDPVMSFWSNFERGEGGLQILHLFALFILTVLLFREERDWRKFFGWILTGGVLMVGYGLFAAWDIPGFIGGNFGDGGFRFSGSIGNPAYVAAFAIFMVFYAGYLLFSKYRHRLFSGGAFFLYGVCVIMAGAFLSAATRGAFLGFLAGLVAAAAYFVFVHRAWRRWFMLGTIILVLLVGTLVFFKNSPLVSAIPGSRIFDISLTTETFRHRAIMWGMALEGWKDRPILGWGPENYINVFDRKLDPAYFNPTEGFGAWFDRAHSVYFDYLVETGILGLLSFLALFVVFTVVAFRKRVSEGNDESIVPRALMFGVFVAYLVQGIVLFDVLPIYYNLFVTLAFVAFFFENHITTKLPPSKPSIQWKCAATSSLLVILAAGSLVFGVYAPVAKARAYINALQTAGSITSVDSFITHFTPALTHWSPIGQEEVVKFLSSDVGSMVGTGNQLEEGMRGLIAFIEPYLLQNNVRHLLVGGHLYYGLWSKYGGDSEDYVRAERYYEAARAIGPALPPVLYALFDLYLNGGNYEKAQVVGEDILRLWPDAQDVRGTLGTISSAGR
ncbi:MAG: O-antigen ligase family protein [Candidatus Brennerbacteria bacterium]